MKITQLGFLLIFSILLFTNTSCKKQEGCTDPESETYDPDAEVNDGSCVYLRDQVVGDWTAVKMIVNGNDGIGLGVFTSVDFEFDADGTFEWLTIASAGNAYPGDGTWEIDDDFLEITFTPNTFTICSDDEHRFTMDFDGEENEELRLEDNCSDGQPIAIELIKD